ncbi:hypothetical protein GCM10023094_38400 [Rhodococcus olei]|uniref:Secreted protein n=1 Tax=Rhodococcus olei TaxID=2161675 RepID=A0ABP8PE42_9NOCA
MSESRIARTVAAVATALALSVAAGTSAAAAPSAAASSTAAPVTTAFQVPLTYLSNCFFLLMCGLPLPVTVTPTVTPGPAAGTVTFDVLQQTLSYDCDATWIHWRNLATGASGDTRVDAASRYLGRGASPCDHTVTEVSTGSGPVVATVTAPPGGDPPLVTVNPGFGAFLVP